MSFAVFWFRRDLRLHDNTALYHALKNHNQVLPIFIFDNNILDKLENKADARVNFVYNALLEINLKLKNYGSGLQIFHSKPIDVFKKLVAENNISAVYSNRDYEPYACQRDSEILKFLAYNKIEFYQYKDQVVFEQSDIISSQKKPYTIFTPYCRKWKETLNLADLNIFKTELYFKNFIQTKPSVIKLKDLGFKQTAVPETKFMFNDSILLHYENQRDFPYIQGTTRIGHYLRFGIISVRQAVNKAMECSQSWLNELVWREFFMQVLYHFPNSSSESFQARYKFLQWRNNEAEFEKWCRGITGVPIVDAGMRELNATGFMHNRVRMITASYLTRHLLIDWRWGEAYFAQKLLDFELASNVGNWQWAAGTGCDAVPYFRMFNPDLQQKKFDPLFEYVEKWVPEHKSKNYPSPIISQALAKERMLQAFKKCLSQTKH